METGGSILRGVVEFEVFGPAGGAPIAELAGAGVVKAPLIARVIQSGWAGVITTVGWVLNWGETTVSVGLLSTGGSSGDGFGVRINTRTPAPPTTRPSTAPSNNAFGPARVPLCFGLSSVFGNMAMPGGYDVNSKRFCVKSRIPLGSNPHANPIILLLRSIRIEIAVTFRSRSRIMSTGVQRSLI